MWGAPATTILPPQSLSEPLGGAFHTRSQSRVIKLLTVKRLPLVIFLLFFACYFSLSNPGYFWDDWVWIFKGKDEAIRIGRELGIWWGGYATYAINMLPHPALFIRWFVLVFWLATSYFVAKFLVSEGWMEEPLAFILALLHAITPVALVRYQTSVAFYCFYLACFWFGVIVYTRFRGSCCKWLSLPLFFFSFYLNSLLVIYCLLIVYIFIRYQLGTRYVVCSWRDAARLIRNERKALQTVFWQELLVFFRSHKVFFLLPVFFYAVKSATTLHSQMYADYNVIQFSDLVLNFFQILPYFFKSVHDVLAVAIFNSSLKGFLIAGAISYILIFRAFRGQELFVPEVAKAGIMIFASLVLGFFSILPYVLVGKPPILSSYYESRHILPAMPALLLFILGGVNLSLAYINQGVLRKHLGYFMVSVLLSLFSMASMFIGADVWKDWLRQDAIISYVKNQKEAFADVGTFIFVDSTSGYRIGGRQIWNYEYTGNVITAKGGRSSLGVDSNEYRAWGNNEFLLYDDFYRERYNIPQYDFTAKHVFINIRNGSYHPSLGIVFAITVHNIMGRPWSPSKGSLFDINYREESRVFPSVMVKLRSLVQKIELYRKEHGRYPLSYPHAQPGSFSLKSDGSISPIALSYTDIIGMKSNEVIPGIDFFPMEPGFFYLSDGVDYKLIYKGAPDYDYAKIAIPKNADIKNRGYGFWTDGAKKW